MTVPYVNYLNMNDLRIKLGGRSRSSIYRGQVTSPILQYTPHCGHLTASELISLKHSTHFFLCQVCLS